MPDMSARMSHRSPPPDRERQKHRERIIAIQKDCILLLVDKVELTQNVDIFLTFIYNEHSSFVSHQSQLAED